MSGWLHTLHFILILNTFLWIPAVADRRPVRVEEYKINIRAQDRSGRPVPATLVITAQRTKFYRKKLLQSGPFTVGLPSGDTYQIEATLAGYQTAKKLLKLGRITDNSEVQQTVTLEMSPTQTPVRIYVIDHETGQPILGGFLVQIDNRSDQDPYGPQLVSESSVTLQAAPQQPLRFVVKAKGYTPHSYEVADASASNQVTVRLRRQPADMVRPYDIRVMDGDYRHVLPRCEVKVTDEYRKPVPVSLDSYTGDWRVLLSGEETYTIEVKAQGFRSYRGTLTRPPQSLILVVLYREIAFASGEGSGATETPPASTTTTTAESAPVSPPVAAAQPTTTKPATEPAPPVTKPTAPPAKTTGKQDVLTRLADKLGRSDSDLSELTRGKTVTLDNVFFDQSSYVLRPESNAQLDQLVALLNRNPALRVEIGGHTDGVGDSRLNFFLSENRAKVVHTYLINQGIARNRLRFKGYGHAHPLAASDSEENRRRNRRVEVRVIEE